jgi:predicted transglutaminase-like cysteine proteinase
MFTKWHDVAPHIYRCGGRGNLDDVALNYVNRKVNKIIRYTPDNEDRWQTPQQTLALGKGDCEDYAILKMDLLGRIFEGCQTDLAITQVRLTGEIHAVAVVRSVNGNDRFLDNLSEVVLTKDRYQRLYREVYVIGFNGWKRSRGE